MQPMRWARSFGQHDPPMRKPSSICAENTPSSNEPFTTPQARHLAYAPPCFHRHREYLHMDCLFVRAGHRGAGIGAALIASVVQFAQAHELNEVQWQTPDWNVDAARFYRRLGGVAQQKVRFVLSVTPESPTP